MTEVDATRATMLSLAELAKRDGVSKQAVSKKVQRLIASGLSVELDGRGRVSRINVAHYDALRARFDNPSKAQRPNKPEKPARAIKPAAVAPAAPSTAPGPEVGQNYALQLGGDESYDEALRQKTWLEAERRRYEIDLLKGRSFEGAVVRAAFDRATSLMIAAIDQGKDFGDDFATAVGRDGVRGAHAMVATLLRTLREAAARLFSEEARAFQPPPDEIPPNQ